MRIGTRKSVTDLIPRPCFSPLRYVRDPARRSLIRANSSRARSRSAGRLVTPDPPLKRALTGMPRRRAVPSFGDVHDRGRTAAGGAPDESITATGISPGGAHPSCASAAGHLAGPGPAVPDTGAVPRTPVPASRVRPFARRARLQVHPRAPGRIVPTSAGAFARMPVSGGGARPQPIAGPGRTPPTARGRGSPPGHRYGQRVQGSRTASRSGSARTASMSAVGPTILVPHRSQSQ